MNGISNHYIPAGYLKFAKKSFDQFRLKRFRKNTAHNLQIKM